MKIKSFFTILLASMAMSLFAAVPTAETVRVVKVIDGDTVWVTRSTGSSIKVRMRYIDAPESCQDYGSISTAAMSALVLNKDAELKIYGTSYDRYVGTLSVDGKDVAERLLADGDVWLYRQVVPKTSKLRAIEDKAKAQKLGVFGTNSPVEPWVFRKTHKCTHVK